MPDDDQMLRASDPHPNLDLSPLRGVLDDMAHETTTGPRRHRPGIWAKAGITVVALGLAVPPLAWAAGTFLAQTGEYGSPGKDGRRHQRVDQHLR